MSHSHGNGNREQLSAEELERQHFKKVVKVFKHYKEYSLLKVNKSQHYYETLPAEDKALVNDMPFNFDRIRDCIFANQSFFSDIVMDVGQMFDNDNPLSNTDDPSKLDQHPLPTTFDMDKLRTTLRQFVRDWSAEGKAERDSCYTPIIDQIRAKFPNDRNNVKVLVPGAGLGRLAFEIAKLGYECQGNEWSVYMLFASHYIINKCPSINYVSIHPWVSDTCNQWSHENQIQKISIPDVNPQSLPYAGLFSMVAGDFLEVYVEENQWHCVACCFFIDTAHNIIEYLKRIYKILRPGGYFINLSPLLFHFSDIPGENSLDITYEQVINICKKLGFIITHEDRSLTSTYIENTKSMMRYSYNTPLFVGQKPPSNS